MPVVFTNGCYDVLHVGHIRLLEYCSELAGSTGKVIVGINSDQSVRRIKGPKRPVNMQGDRRRVLESIIFVNSVEVFEEDTPLELIKRLGPDIIVKGGDYTPEQVVGYGLAEVRIFNYLEGYSTTKTLQDLSGW